MGLGQSKRDIRPSSIVVYPIGQVPLSSYQSCQPIQQMCQQPCQQYPQNGIIVYPLGPVSPYLPQGYNNCLC